MAISFQIHHPSFKLKHRPQLRAWLKALIAEEKMRTGALNFILMTDDELIKVNREYLGHDTFTDIITFDYRIKDTIAGDILISIDRVAENAEKFRVNFSDELVRVLAHGVLHICGYKDKRAADRERMRSRENKAIKLYHSFSKPGSGKRR